MPRLELFLVAENVVIDQETNQLSIFNLYEEVSSPKLPNILLKVVILSLWMRDDDELGELECSLKLRITPTGQDSAEFPTNFTFVPSSKRHRIVQRIHGMVLKNEGPLKFEMLMDGELKGDYSVSVFKRED